MSKRESKRKNRNKHNGSAAPTSTKSTNNVLTQLDALRQRIGLNPDDSKAWKELARICLEQNELEVAVRPARRAAELLPNDPEVLSMRAAVEYNEGNIELAIKLFRQVIELSPNNPRPHHDLATIFHRRGQHELALQEVEKGLALETKNLHLMDIKGAALRALHRLDESYSVYKTLVEENPDVFTLWIDLGNLSHDLGDIEEALRCYEKAKGLNHKDATAYSNHLTSLHYHPRKTRDEIFQACLEWDKKYAPQVNSTPPRPQDLSPSRPLRIGFISDGFRKNPVGLMITSALEKMPSGHYEFYAYTTNNVVDTITQRLQKIFTKWIPIPQTHGERLRDKIREDEIDILIDLAGHHKGSRMPALAMKPAPVIIKWVGGLINTTGVSAIDYLISDRIETPEGVDGYYTEKLIRMPDDYICYDPPEYAPPVNELPALGNGFITFGCFNNPLKINPDLIREWAELLKQLPASKLFLKSFQYNSAALCDKVAGWLAEHGIERSRLIFEGASPHPELLKAYNRVDIALDPWPYSGGLTTCEALLMGVPAVTMPGPTFAGRHSASHLVNAGLPELVTNNWEEYRARVLDLVSDLNSLATIRSHLRTVLLQSPACNADIFAGHLDNALRGIWQRYTEGKPPAALSFNESGQVLFEGEESPVELHHPEAPPEKEDSTFRWELEGKVIAIDHGGQLMDTPVIKQMLELGTLELVVFDPAGNRTKHPLRSHAGCHYYPNMALGNGEPGTLYACQEEKLTGTLKPAQHAELSAEDRKRLQIIAELPIGTVALDHVNELPSIDWLVLDNLNNCTSILENGERSLSDTLLIHAKVSFQLTHEQQPNFADVEKWAQKHEFRFYCFDEMSFLSHFPTAENHEKKISSELVTANAIFIPTNKRLNSLDKDCLKKLSFILGTVYKLYDISYKLLSKIDKKLAQSYLIAIGIEPAKNIEGEKNQEHQQSHEDDTISSDLDKILGY